ncbi:hypothetical protein HZF05_17945 [Sphingomonas sp. CGMCC 1.13654]|uniref:DUF2793 domain-containing protein n=1 Tax=Sphingomonas chungangi TaxID=2683589 RepID=A0A838LCW0_9SPHN|nr:hypothetical protein [Sphingomonas chungangi]MBA2935966.1 hypothetical protein [Sphingomonas chungangi]MVW55356.1 hypothetical protein [Sphingomonas chungangi]
MAADPNPLVFNPSPTITSHAVAYGQPGSAAVAVDPDHPLPVGQRWTAATATPLVGSASASGAAGPFTPELGRAIWLTLGGTWAGTVRVLRSLDGGTTCLPLSAGGQPWGVFTANAQEPVREETVAGATYWLDIALTSGTLTYEVRQ